MSSNAYLATAREVVFSYKERNGPGVGGLLETKQRHRLRGFQTQNLALKKIDFSSDKALMELPEYQHMKQEGVNAVTSPRSGSTDRAFSRHDRRSTALANASKKKSHSYAGHLDLSHKKLGDDYTYAAVKALGTTVHRTDIDYLTRKELDSAFHTLSEGEDSEEEEGESESVKNKRSKRKKKNSGKMSTTGVSTSKEANHHSITHIVLKDNRLSDRGLVKVVDCICSDGAITPFIRSIDLSENAGIRRKGAEALTRLLRHTDNLSVLSLEKMSFNDTTLRVLCKGLTQECSLTSLNLSGNNISDAGCTALAKVLAGAGSSADSGADRATAPVAAGHDASKSVVESKHCEGGGDTEAAHTDITHGGAMHLKELDLSWNEIQSKGAVALINAIGENSSLLKLDISWNAIGTKSEATRAVAQALSTCLAKNSTLIHIDLSQNQLSAADCGIISEGLKNNHTLLGLHMTGNQGSVDCYGNLVPDVELWPAEASHQQVMTRICNTEVAGREKWMLRNNCWLCGAHRETLFEYTLTLSQSKQVMNLIMADPAQMSIMQARASAAAAAKKREEKKKKEALAAADPYGHMFTGDDAASSEEKSGADNNSTSQEAVVELPELAESVQSAVRLLTSFDKWQPEEMQQVKEGHLSHAYQRRTVRPTTTPGSSYQYRGQLGRNRLPVGEDDAKAVAANSFAYAMSVHNHRKFSNAKSDVELIASVNKEAEQDSPVKQPRENDGNSNDEDGHIILIGSHRERTRRKDVAEEEEKENVQAAAVEAVKEEEKKKEEEEKSAASSGSGTYAVDEDDNDQARAANRRPKFALHRMVPPGVHYYCIQVDDLPLSFDPFQPHVRTASLLKLGLQGPLKKIVDQVKLRRPTTVPNPPADDKKHHPQHKAAGGKHPGHKPSSPKKSAQHPRLKAHGGRFKEPDHNNKHKPPTSAEEAKQELVVPELTEKEKAELRKQKILTTLPKYINTITVQEQTAAEKLNGPAAMFSQLKPRVKQNDSVVQKIWTWRDSLFFNNTQKHEQSFLTRCFTKDWAHTRTAKSKDKGEASALETLLCSNFALITAIFSHYSCLYSSEFYMMGMAALNELVTKCFIIEGVSKNDDDYDSDVGDDWRLLANVTTAVTKFHKGTSMDGGGRSDGKKTIASGKSFRAGPAGVNGARPLAPVASGKRGSKSAKTSTKVAAAAGEGGSVAGDDSATVVTHQTGVHSSTAPGTTRTEIELIFVSNTITGPRHEYNSKRALCRFQFLDVLVSLANVKFVKTGKCIGIVAAVEKLLSEHLEPYAERLDGNAFREKYLYCQHTDDMLRKHMTSWDRMYQNYTGEENTPLEDKTMSFREWNLLTDTAGLDEEYLTERNMKLTYVGSLRYYADMFDESNEFKKMTKLEFLECLVRASYSMHQQRLLKAGVNGTADPSLLLDGASSVMANPNLNTVSALSMDKSSASVSAVAPVSPGSPGGDYDDGQVRVTDFLHLLEGIAGKRSIQKKKKH
jgi:hypothetical protein